MEKQKPLLIFDRDPLKNKRYFFVSYSHKDKEIDYALLESLYPLGANYWYDKGLSVGDEWDEEVEKYIRNKSCIGSILFISKDSIMSKAILKEVSIISDIKNNNPSFRIVPVIVDGSSIDDVFAKAISDFGYEKATKNIEPFRELMNKEKMIYLVYKSVEETSLELYQSFEEMNCLETQNFNTANPNFKKLKWIIENNSVYYSYGRYQFSDKEIPIMWKLVKQEENIVFLVSKYCLDFAFQSDISGVLDKIEKSFPGYIPLEQFSLITDDLLDSCSENIGRFIPSDFADMNRAQLLKLFWIKTANGYKVCNANGKMINNNFDFSIVNCGIRPFIKIDLTKIREEY